MYRERGRKTNNVKGKKGLMRGMRFLFSVSLNEEEINRDIGAHVASLVCKRNSLN
jgi:hypothetical protein